MPCTPWNVFCKIAPQGRKRAYTGCNQTTSVLAEPGMVLYHPLDGITNLKYKLLYFLTPNEKNSKRKALAFNRDRRCHLAIRLQLEGLPSKYYPGPMLLNFRVLMGTGVSNMVQ
jgi:hypothetical protein